MMHQHNKLATPSKSCRKVKLIANLPQRVVLNGDFNSDCRFAPSILEKSCLTSNLGDPVNQQWHNDVPAY
jgi:hypothetical protein